MLEQRIDTSCAQPKLFAADLKYGIIQTDFAWHWDICGGGTHPDALLTAIATSHPSQTIVEGRATVFHTNALRPPAHVNFSTDGFVHDALNHFDQKTGGVTHMQLVWSEGEEYGRYMEIVAAGVEPMEAAYLAGLGQAPAEFGFEQFPTGVCEIPTFEDGSVVGYQLIAAFARKTPDALG